MKFLGKTGLKLPANQKNILVKIQKRGLNSKNVKLLSCLSLYLPI